MNYYPKILPFYMTYPMPLIWEEEDTVMRDLEYLQELYPRQAKKYRKRIEELLERFDSEGSVLYDEYPDRMTLYKMAQDIYAVLEQEEKREQAEAAARSRAQTGADCKAMLARTQQEIRQRWAAFDRRASELLDGYHSTEFLPEERADK